ncbi:MAG: phenylacetate-CoA oxygenase subunit PaaJ [Bacteroidetes bacterium]|nr:phenylacetate-CoA oxygenase subunit PaaJ [Bacteroidota bacterium]
MLNNAEILNLLHQVPDPEIPVISVVELGVVRSVEINGQQIIVTLSPTYTGCPAMKTMEEDILAKLHSEGFSDVKIIISYAPAWTTDWISEEAKEKLRLYGIAPPEKTSSDKNILFGARKTVKCPQCKSENTEMKSQFGSTACKALYKCLDCLEPFDYFKCI